MICYTSYDRIIPILRDIIEKFPPEERKILIVLRGDGFQYFTHDGMCFFGITLPKLTGSKIWVLVTMKGPETYQVKDKSKKLFV